MTENGRYAFDANNHEYVDTDTGDVLPHITGMLKRCGWVDDEWFTDECRERGSAVHRLTADYDMGAIEDPNAVVSRYKPWLQAHVRGVQLVRPVFSMIELALVHPQFRYGGRPDRAGQIYEAVALAEVKSGPYEKAHGVQTALQAILLEPRVGIPARSIRRYGWYVTGKGKFKLEAFEKAADFDEAYRIINRCCTF